MPACPLLDWRQPLNLKHPLNAGKVLHLYGSRGKWGGGTWLDLCKRNNGTLTNGPAWTPTGRGDVGLTFAAASSQRVSASAPALLGASQLTLLFWAKRTAGLTMTFGVYSSTTARTNIEIWNDGEIYFALGNGANSFGYCANSSTDWQRVGLVFNGGGGGNAGRLAAYVNGQPQTLTFSGTIPATTAASGTLYVGFEGGSPTYSDGVAGDCCAFNRALSPAEVALDYALSSRGYRTADPPLNFVRGAVVPQVQTFSPWWVGRSYSVLGGGAV